MSEETKKTTAEQFGEWLSGQMNRTSADVAQEYADRWNAQTAPQTPALTAASANGPVLDMMAMRAEIARTLGVPLESLNSATCSEVEKNFALVREYQSVIKKMVSNDTGISADRLSGYTEEEIRASAAAAKEADRAAEPMFPEVKDGGEVVVTGETRPAREQFAEWLAENHGKALDQMHWAAHARDSLLLMKPKKD